MASNQIFFIFIDEKCKVVNISEKNQVSTEKEVLQINRMGWRKTFVYEENTLSSTTPIMIEEHIDEVLPLVFHPVFKL